MSLRRHLSELPAADQARFGREPAKWSKSALTVLSLMFVGSCAFLMHEALRTDIPASPAPTTSRGAPSATVSHTRYSVTIENTNTRDWSHAELYVNGRPPSAFKATVTAPSLGQSTTIHLSDFVDRDGNRFDPEKKAVTEVWVGGSGYDFACFKFAR